jgi:hypothetical protein
MTGLSFFLLAAGAAAKASPPAATVAATPPWWWTAILAPALTGCVAVIGAWVAIAFDRRKSANQELIKKRLEIYDSVVPKANDLLCYFTCVGNWKALTPDMIIANKREMDRLAHVYGPLFSTRTRHAYDLFIILCFKVFVGSGLAAQIRADVSYLKSEWQGAWQGAWDTAFVSPGESVSLPTLRAAYDELLSALAKEIGAKS